MSESFSIPNPVVRTPRVHIIHILVSVVVVIVAATYFLTSSLGMHIALSLPLAAVASVLYPCLVSSVYRGKERAWESAVHNLINGAGFSVPEETSVSKHIEMYSEAFGMYAGMGDIPLVVNETGEQHMYHVRLREEALHFDRISWAVPYSGTITTLQ